MKILDRIQIREKVRLSLPTIWRMERAGQFPGRIQLGARRIGWYEHEIDEWLEGRKRVNGKESGGF
jgi:prophage regulatory protein